MQDRYAGDVGDYIKLGLLRHLARGSRLGVAWYLHPDESHNGDGRHVSYLDLGSHWRHLDPKLFDALQMLARTHRSVSALENIKVLDAVYASEPLQTPVLNGPQRDQWRSEWFERSLGVLRECNLIFADPDNGLVDNESKRRRHKKFAKRIPLNEVRSLAADRPAVIYHHNTRFKGGHEAEIDHWLAQLGDTAFAIRSRAYSCRTFFVVNPDDALRMRAAEFSTRWSDHGVSMIQPARSAFGGSTNKVK